MHAVKIYITLLKNWSTNWYKSLGLIKIYTKKCHGINTVSNIYINSFKIVFTNYCICIFYTSTYPLEHQFKTKYATFHLALCKIYTNGFNIQVNYEKIHTHDLKIQDEKYPKQRSKVMISLKCWLKIKVCQTLNLKSEKLNCPDDEKNKTNIDLPRCNIQNIEVKWWA